VRFHSIIWPAILMALDIPLPKKVYGHGWMLLGSDKISKSKGNIIDPVILSDRYSVDAVRYYLLREIPFGSDGIYTNNAFLSRLNADLCNSLGNLLSRSCAMVNQYFGGLLPKGEANTEFDNDLLEKVNSLFEKVQKNVDELLIPEALQEIFNVVNRANKYIDETQPWLLQKDPSRKDELATVLYNLIDTLRVVGIVLLPFLPNTAKRILADISVDAPKEFGDNVKAGQCVVGSKITKGELLFARVNVNKELEAMDKLAKEIEKEKTADKVEKEKKVENAKAEITIDDFDKLELKVGKIIAAKKVEKSKKLLHFTVDTGDRERSIVSGVAKTYKPEEMLSKQVVVVTNLKPVTLGGVLSEGMILFADDGDGVVTIEPSKEIKPGSTVS